MMDMFSNLFALLYRMYEKWGETDPFFRVSLTIGVICAFTLQLFMAILSKYSSYDMLKYGPVGLAIFNMGFIALVAWVCHTRKNILMTVVNLKSYSSGQLIITLILLFALVFTLLMGAVFTYSS